MIAPAQGDKPMQYKQIPMRKILIPPILLFVLCLLSHAQIQQKKPEVPYVSTPEEVVAEMLKMANVGKDDVLYDLGCGDGRIVITAAKELGCRGVGIDIDPIRIKESQENAIKAGVSDRIEFRLIDLFEADISQASVVTLYLLTRVNLKLRPKLFRELNPGTRLVSHDFDMGQWKSDKSTIIEGENRIDYAPPHETFVLPNNWDRHNVYLWIIPANVTGVWKWTLPTVTGQINYSLELEQEFQEVMGKAFADSISIPVSIENGKINGDRLAFTLERQIKGKTEQLFFEAFVTGHVMEGVVRIADKPDLKAKFRAERILSTFRTIDQPE